MMSGMLLLDIYDHLPIFHVYDHNIVDSEILHTINESNINDSNINISIIDYEMRIETRCMLTVMLMNVVICFMIKFTDLYTFVCLVL